MERDAKPPTMCEVFNRMWEDVDWQIWQMEEEQQGAFRQNQCAVRTARETGDFMKSYHMLFALQQQIQVASSVSNASSETA